MEWTTLAQGFNHSSSLTLPGNAHHLQVLEAASVSNQLSQGDHNATLADYRALRESEKVKFPRDITEVGITLGRYAVLCQALLQGTGPPNPAVEVHWNLVPGTPERCAVYHGSLLAGSGHKPDSGARVLPLRRALRASQHA